ncbi:MULTISPECIES: glycosyltransferase [Methylosinus]|uniref:Glycosyltransferase subfamily 4-like N-terminal domain-containing protein n=1 Tax=Methylosinus trichosporium (strain ATCC 35070 / NCIMB 11131 / UNIQEM 75 / OB3b) TaxID=595536 RepID=A0A2D2D4F7_METT3|nr:MULTISPECIES: glycosyltransferase [Methylosinus]ATQ69900.1 hypothetical protein CQW49_19940 [Methylosinus trichosporium OB3b]OBS53885.1 hypothetical protein A8B73_03715 [Methylosinus sp. 3S-1]
MTTHRNVIILSPHFPPSTVAGVHRARHLAKHLPAFGWKPVVLCVHERFHAQSLDPELARLVDPSTRVEKVAALPTAMSRRFGVGDIGLRALPQLGAALARLSRDLPARAVVITGSPFYPMLLSAIAKRCGAKVVLDFQDPWVSRWGATQSSWSKAGAAHRLATALEPLALRHADFVTSVSDVQNSEMAERHRWLDATRMAGLPIGGDPEDFVHLRSMAKEAAAPRGEKPIVLSFVGAFMPRSTAPMRALLRGFALLRASEPRLAERLELNFIGTSNSPDDTTGFRVRPLAEVEGVADQVRETPRRLPYLEALAALACSDGLLLVGSDEPHYTASKIYPALMSGRPWLSLFHRSSSANAILRAAGGGVAVDFASDEELVGAPPVIAGALRRLATESDAFGVADPNAYAPYQARAIAGRFAAIFDSLVGERVASPSMELERN